MHLHTRPAIAVIPTPAQANFERGLACWRALSEPSTARCLHNLANVAKVRGDSNRGQSAPSGKPATSSRKSVTERRPWSLNQQGDIYARTEGH